jgi:hypothetical protein
LVKGLIKLDTVKSLSVDKLNNPRAKNYYYELWTFINASPTPNPSPIMYRVGDLGIWINTNNELVLVKNSTSAVYGSTDVLFTIMNSFPLQKWVHIVVNVINHGSSNTPTTIECYINGKLIITKPSVDMKTSVPTGDLIMGKASGLNGYLTRAQRVPNNIMANTVWDHYLQGNGIGGVSRFFAQYHVDMNVTKDQVLQRNIRLF